MAALETIVEGRAPIDLFQIARNVLRGPAGDLRFQRGGSYRTGAAAKERRAKKGAGGREGGRIRLVKEVRGIRK